MLEERDALAIRGDAQVAQVAAGPVHHLADRILEAVLSIDEPDDREVLTIGRPRRLPHFLKDLPRRGAPERRPGQRTGEQTMREIPRPCQDRQLAALRDVEKVGVDRADPLRLGVFGPDGEELSPVAGEGGAQDDRFSVGHESRVEYRLWLKGHAVEGDAGARGGT